MEYRLGIYEKAMPDNRTLEEKLRAAKQAKFDFLEISIDETEARQDRLLWSSQQRNDLHQAMAETGLSIDTMCLSGHRKWSLGSRDGYMRQRGQEMFRRAVEFAHEFGIRIIQLAGYDVYYEPGDEQTRAWFLEGLKQGIDYAASYGVLCGFETMETPFMDTIEKAMAYVKQVDSPYLGVYPDLGNLTNACFLYQKDILNEIACGKGHLMAMHLKETVEGKYRDMRFGEGRVEFVKGIQKAGEMGVRCFVAECWDDGREHWQGALGQVNDFLRACFDKAAKQ